MDIDDTDLLIEAERKVDANILLNEREEDALFPWPNNNCNINGSTSMDIENNGAGLYEQQQQQVEQQIEKAINEKITPQINRINHFQKIIMNSTMLNECIENINNNPTEKNFNKQKYKDKNYFKARNMQKYMHSEIRSFNQKIDNIKYDVENIGKTQRFDSRRIENVVYDIKNDTKKKLINYNKKLDELDIAIDDMNQNISESGSNYLNRINNNTYEIEDLKDEFESIKEKQKK
eukprot:219298_1